MREMIDCFLPDLDRQAMATTLSQLDDSKAVRSVFWMEGPLASSNSVMSIAERARAPYVLLFTKTTPVSIGQRALERMLRVACESGASMVYADRYERKRVGEEWAEERHPVIDYQLVLSAMISISAPCGW